MCIYSQLKTCSASEVAAMIEGVLRHCTDAEIEANYTDTHGVVVTWTPLVPLAPLAPGCRPVVRGSGGPDPEVSVRVRQQRGEDGSHRVELLDEDGEPVEVVSGFLRFLAARDCSPNTLVSYAYDLRHLWRFFDRDGLTWAEFAPRHSIALLEYLRSVPSRRPRQRMTLTVVVDADGPATKLAATTVNRILAAVSSFYEYVILAGMFDRLNPIEKRPDPALQRVSDRHRPVHGRRQPAAAGPSGGAGQDGAAGSAAAGARPRSQALLAQLRSKRDRAIVLLMLQGGLRPGEVLGLHLEDIAYGRRRVVVRHRDDHPEGGAVQVPLRAGGRPARARDAGRGQRLRDGRAPGRRATARWCS